MRRFVVLTALAFFGLASLLASQQHVNSAATASHIVPLCSALPGPCY